VVGGDLDLAVVFDWHGRPMPLPDGLAEDGWGMWAEGEFCREWLRFTLRARGIEPMTAHQVDETHTQLGLVQAGFAPRPGRDPEPGGVVSVPLRQGVRWHVYGRRRPPPVGQGGGEGAQVGVGEGFVSGCQVP
jgi:hypothetical protein